LDWLDPTVDFSTTYLVIDSLSAFYLLNMGFTDLKIIN